MWTYVGILICVSEQPKDKFNDVEKAQQNDKISELYKAFGNEHTLKDKIDMVFGKIIK